MSKINSHSKGIQKKKKIQPALRVNASHKWKLRVRPLLAGVESLFFKLKRNSNVSEFSTNVAKTTIDAQISGKYDFKSARFKLNAKRHALHGSNQG